MAIDLIAVFYCLSITGIDSIDAFWPYCPPMVLSLWCLPMVLWHRVRSYCFLFRIVFNTFRPPAKVASYVFLLVLDLISTGQYILDRGTSTTMCVGFSFLFLS